MLLRGAKLCVVKTQRKAKQAETLTQDYIITRKLYACPLLSCSVDCVFFETEKKKKKTQAPGS